MPAGLRPSKLRQHACGLRCKAWRCALTITAQPRFRGWAPNRSSIFRYQWRHFSRCRYTARSSTRLDTFTCRILTTRFVRSSIGQSGGRTVTMCMSSKGADVRNDEHWHFATTYETVPPWRARYEQLKRRIAEQVVAADPKSQERYAVAKTEFVERVVALAIARGYPADL